MKEKSGSIIKDNMADIDLSILLNRKKLKEFNKEHSEMYHMLGMQFPQTWNIHNDLGEKFSYYDGAVIRGIETRAIVDKRLEFKETDYRKMYVPNCTVMLKSSYIELLAVKKVFSQEQVIIDNRNKLCIDNLITEVGLVGIWLVNHVIIKKLVYTNKVKMFTPEFIINKVNELWVHSGTKIKAGSIGLCLDSKVKLSCLDERVINYMESRIHKYVVYEYKGDRMHVIYESK